MFLLSSRVMIEQVSGVIKVGVFTRQPGSGKGQEKRNEVYIHMQMQASCSWKPHNCPRPTIPERVNAVQNDYLGFILLFPPLSSMGCGCTQTKEKCHTYSLPQTKSTPTRMLASPLQNRLHTTSSTHLVSWPGSLPICLGSNRFCDFSAGQVGVVQRVWSVQSLEAWTSTYTSWHRDGATVLNASATTTIQVSALPKAAFGQVWKLINEAVRSFSFFFWPFLIDQS